MPELPEVESLRQSLLPFVQNKTIKKIEVNQPKLISSSGTKRGVSQTKTQEFIHNLTGQTIKDISRRAKNLIFHFNSGKVMLVHLKMTGQLVYQDPQNQISGGHPISNQKLPGKHTHLIFTLNKGTLYYNDVRQFGYLLYFPSIKHLNQSKLLDHYGPEPFSNDFTITYFSNQLKKTKTNLKTALMSQKIVTGPGNIYCDEICFASKVLPQQPSRQLTTEEIDSVFLNLKQILQKAIDLNGSSISDYLLADGSRGNYARELKVYGRANQACYVCQTILKTTKINSRTTVYCPQCQK